MSSVTGEPATAPCPSGAALPERSSSRIPDALLAVRADCHRLVLDWVCDASGGREAIVDRDATPTARLRVARAASLLRERLRAMIAPGHTGTNEDGGTP